MSNFVFDMEDAYPMTKLQKGMLFYSEYNIASPVYHEIASYQLKGHYNIKAWQEAVQYLIALHPVLRTSFNLSDFSEPVQIVHKEAEAIIKEADLRNTIGADRSAIFTKWLDEEKLKEFNWKQAPLFRLQTHRWTDDEFSISVCYHHSILDGFSAVQMMMVLFGVYLNKLGKISYLPEPIENNVFRDYVAWELDAVKSEASKDYWLKKLDGLSSNQIVYQDSMGNGYKTKKVDISTEMLNGLKAIARSEGVPLNVILLAAHLLVMCTMTGKFDVVTGLVTSGKPEDINADCELGLFINTVPCRIQLPGGTWKQLVKQVYDTEKEMLPHRRYPLAEISKQIGNSQLFESIFNYMNMNAYKMEDELSDYLKITDFGLFEQTNFPLASQFSLNHLGNKLSLNLVYDTDRFNDQQIEEAGKTFTRIFVSMLQGMDNLYMAGKMVRYWQNRFQESLSTYELRQDHVSSGDHGFNPCEVQFSTDRLTRDELLGLGRQNKTDLYSVLLAAFNVFLYKYTGQNDAVLWSSGDGIGLRDRNSAVADYLAMNHEVSDDERFSRYLVKVGDGVAEALDCQDHVFENIMRNRLLGLRPKNTSLYNVIFSLKSDGLEQPVTFDEKIGNFNLALEAVEGNEGIRFTLRINNMLFAEESITRMKIHFQNILQQIVNTPDMLIKDIILITNKERSRILDEFNDTFAHYDRKKTIHRRFEEQAATIPDKTAVICQGQKLTYSELNRKANRLARALRRKGVGPNSIVGIMTERSLEMLVAVYAILKAGGAYMPIEPGYPKERIRYMLQDSEAVMLLTKGNIGRNIFFAGEIADITDGQWYEDDDVDLEPINTSRDLAYVIYTSGSTGNPKGVMIEHHSLVNRIEWMHKAYPIDGSDIILQKTPYTFDVSLWELFWWGIAGASIVLLEANGEKDPDLVLEAIYEHKVTVIHFVPSMFNSFLNYIEIGNHHEKLSSLKQIFNSGEALATKHVEMFFRNAGSYGTRLINLYGPTEATVDVSYYECSPADEHLNTIPIGKPIDNISLYVVGSNNELLPIGIAGELCIGGVGLARGYINNKELTREKFVENPFCPGDRMYRTGDLARWRADGNIEYLGRIDNQVKLRGYRIELGEIESVMRQHPGVKDLVVTIRQFKSEPMNRKLVAYVVHKEKNGPTAMELRAFAGYKLPDYMIPEIIMVLDSIPLTSSGKANVKALPDPDFESLRSDTPYVEATNPTEITLVGIWSKVLGVKRVGIDDNYFSLGGDSILSIQIMALARKQQLNMTIPDLFRYPTIRRLSAKLGVGETSYEEEVVGEDFDLISREDRKRLVSYKM